MAMAGNAIQPGVVAGDRIRRVIDANARALGAGDEAIRKRPLAEAWLRMVGQLDIANTALFLVTGNGRNISGQALSVCGNVEAMP
jgi:NAD(P)-dependent dehydrogenase (short-subunit alcohol dehydrogenase family)